MKTEFLNYIFFKFLCVFRGKRISSELKTNNNYEQTRKGLLVVLLTLQRGLVSDKQDASPFLFLNCRASCLACQIGYRKLKAEY